MSCNRQCFGPDGLEAVDVDCSECDGRDCGPVNALINYKRLYDIEHRRRVAAEKMIIEPEALSQEGYLDMIEYKKDYDECQSIIKEVGE